MIYLIVVILAFCSMTYELLLSQALSAFLGNTLLRYSTTIGLYLFSLGLGAFIAEKRWDDSPLRALLGVEALLAFVGGLSVVILHLLSILSFNIWEGDLLFSISAHTLIIIIGVLSGFELPLLITIAIKRKGIDAGAAERNILSSSYIGAFISTILFAFWFYPQAGLLSTAFIVALLNATIGLLLCVWFSSKETAYKRYIGVHTCFLVLFLIFQINSESINKELVSHYLTSSRVLLGN